MIDNTDNTYTNNLEDKYDKTMKAKVSNQNFYQTLTLLGIGLILIGIYTVVIVLFAPIINATGSILLDVINYYSIYSRI